MGLRDIFKWKSRQHIETKKPETPEAQAKPKSEEKTITQIGGHWGILCDTEEEVIKTGMNAAGKGDAIAASPADGQNATGFLTHEKGLKVACIVKDAGMILTFYPMSEGIAHPATFSTAFPWGHTFEGDVEISVGPAVFTVFDPLFFRNHSAYQAGNACSFALSGIAYNLERAGDDKMSDREGHEISMNGMAGFFPVTEDSLADYAFRSPVKAIERFEANGKPLLKLTTTLFRIEGKDGDAYDVDIYLYARQDRLNGYMPAIGDDVTGTMWLQGYMVQ